MSLEYWFPLTSDLHNQGVASLANASVQSGCSLSSDGKLGGCYKNTGTTANVATSISFSADQFTLCAWVRIDARTNSWHRAVGLSGSGTYMGMVCEHTNGTSVGFHYYKTIDGTNTAIFDTCPCSPTVGAWYHYAMCYDGTRYYVYLNGNKITDEVARKPNIRAEMTTLWLFGGTSNSYVKDSINDVRIYSHCLSALEIAEIAKGMILHYPMTGGGRGQKNEVKNGAFTDSSGNLAGWNNWGACTIRQVDTIDGVNYAHIKTHGTKWAGLAQNLGTPLDVSSDYTLSFRAFSPTSHSMCFGFHWCNSSGSIISQSWFEQSLTTNPAYYTIKIRSGSTADKFNMMIGWNTDEVAEIYFTDVKIEKGTVPTPWIPHTSDSTYSSMGYNDNIEYDVSGYNNHGTKNGIITYSSDTARYSVSSYFNADANYISRNATSGDIRAASFWIKFPVAVSSTYRVAYADYTSRLAFGMINATTACCTCAGNTIKTFTISQFTVDKWYHIVVQYNSDKSDVQLYINGVAQTTRGNGDSWNHTTSTLMLGKRSTGSTINAYISDFRLYATALSAEDVQELYNTSASISNTGTLLAYEFIEN